MDSDNNNNSDKNNIQELPLAANPEETKKQIIQNSVNAIIIDDSELSRNRITALLESAGHKVIGSASKPSAIKDLLKQAGINLIIVDMVLPEASGTEIIKQLKENLKKVYFILVSNLDEEHLKIESISVGALDYLVKPFSDGQLLGSIDNISRLLNSSEA